MIDYLEALEAHHGGASAHDLMRAHEVRLCQPLLDWARSRNDLRLVGPADATVRAPTVALDLGRAPGPVAADLAKHGIMAEGGDFYAGRPLEAMGVDPAQGVLRLSFVHYTSEADIDRLITALDQVI